MAQIYFTSDTHLGHRSLPFFGYRKDREGNRITSVEQNTNLFIDEWEKTIKKKRDIVYCLGDMAFDNHHNDIIGKLSGRKILIKGNHDYLVPHKRLLNTYESIEGTHKKYGCWISHFPVHPQELWGKKCIHGHVHHATVLSPKLSGLDDYYTTTYWELHGVNKRSTGSLSNHNFPWPVSFDLEDKRYLNLCPENTQLIWNKWIISLDEIREYFERIEDDDN